MEHPRHPYALPVQEPWLPPSPFPAGPTSRASAPAPSPSSRSSSAASPVASSSTALYSLALDDFDQAAPGSRATSSPTILHQYTDRDSLTLHSDSLAAEYAPPYEGMRRQSSNTITRHTVIDEYGREREETREERRARKEHERALRAASIGRHGSPERWPKSSRLDQTSGSADSASTALPHLSASSTPESPPTSTAHRKGGSASSKSVLTIALQRAQSAVLLDSANNFPAAVAAYTQSVRLLKEVMARAEEGSRDMERKLSTGGMRDGETLEDWERRKARYERKERAKMDEARRLRVIHDTYEDRIRMLAQMGHLAPSPSPPPARPLAPPIPSSSLDHPAATRVPSTTSSRTTPYTSAPTFSQASFGHSNGWSPPQHARERSGHSLHIVASAADYDLGHAADDIGAAMLLPSPTERVVPKLTSLPVALARGPGDEPRFLTSNESAGIRPLSVVSDATVTARLHTPDSAPLTPTAHAPIPLDQPSVRSPTDSRASSDGLSTAVEPGSSWSATSVLAEPNRPVRHPALASLDMRRGSSTSILSVDTLRSGASTSGSGLGAQGMLRGSSAGPTARSAPPMRRGSSLGQLGSADANPVEIRPRPVRTASLAGNGQALPPLPTEQYEPLRSQLVNVSTAKGTISQRRSARSPVPPAEDDEVRTRPPQLAVRAPSSEAERPYVFPPPLAAEQSTTSRPALKNASSSSSLPGRLRALSQPGSKRPKLPSFDAEAARPPVPPLLATGQNKSLGYRTVSASHASSVSLSSAPTASSAGAAGILARKSSAPTPTSLTTPSQLYAPLGRSDSTSSIASTTSRVSGRVTTTAGGGGGGSGSPLDTPATSTFPSSLESAHPAPWTGYAGVTGGVYLSKGLPSPPQAGAPSSREAILAVPSVRRPFHLMRLIAATIPASDGGGSGVGGGGGYLSERLFVPAHVWSTSAGTKLVAIETKVRMLDLVGSGLDALERAGRGLLLVPVGSSSAAGAAREEAARFAKELDNFEGLTEGVHATLAKKLGAGAIGATGGGISGGVVAPHAKDKELKQGRKGSTASFSAWSSKLSMGLNRVVANGVSLDSQATYVDAVAKVFRQAQTLDHHLSLVFPASTDEPADTAYALLPLSERHRLERQMRKASEFFGQVVCRFVLRDVGILLDKYVKRGGTWLSGE